MRFKGILEMMWLSYLTVFTRIHAIPLIRRVENNSFSMAKLNKKIVTEKSENPWKKGQND